MIDQCSSVCLRSFGLEIMKRLKRLHHRRRFQHSRLANEAAPDVRDFKPIGFPLRLNADASANQRAQCREGGDRNVIWWALQPLRNIADPWPDRRGKEPTAEITHLTSRAGAA